MAVAMRGGAWAGRLTVFEAKRACFDTNVDDSFAAEAAAGWSHGGASKRPVTTGSCAP